VPEISAQDLRRLKALEGKLEKAQDEKKSFAVERRELLSRVTVAARSAKSAENRAAEVEERLAAMLAENARLAARLDEIKADSERLRAAGLKLREQLDASKKELSAAAAEGKKLTRSLQKTESERARLGERLKLAEAQLKSKTTTPVLPAKEVARLIDGFVDEIGAGLPGMVVRDGEIKLQVAFGKVGQATGFVVPSADAPADVRKNLHEVAIRFDRTLEVAEQE
jgi:predicted RNase H-like nuclease (RuvC/YqgF family)